MTLVDKTSLDWLVDDACHKKALIRYEIKLYESKLNSLLNEKTTTPKMCRMIECCRSLINHCEGLRLITDTRCTFSKTNYVIEQDKMACYQRIQSLQQQFYWRRPGFCEINSLDEILFYYRNLLSLMQEADPQSEFPRSSEPDANLLNLLQTKTAEQWFAAVVTFACELGENYALHRAQLNRLSDDDCLHLYQQFTEVEHLSLLHSLFLLKNGPTTDQSANLHDSCKHKLSLLYLFIQTMHKSIVQILSQRGFNPIYDCLVYDEEKAKVCDQHAIFFNQLIEEWQLIRLIMPEETQFRQKLVELLNAYKYWFNPDLLIDAAMQLRQRVGSSQGEEGFRDYLRSFYQQLTTTECFDLYGYFSNKDTRYLMRTFYAAKQGLSIRGLESLDTHEKETVTAVYEVLNCLMESLLDELRNRHFTVKSYLDNRDKAIKPRHRILRAIKRVLLIYKIDTPKHNELIEQLFAELGG